MGTLLLPGTRGHTASTASLVLLAVIALGLGSGCVSFRADDPAPRVLRVVAGPEAAGRYLRAGAAALPVTRGVPCPTSFQGLGGGTGGHVPRPATSPFSTEEMLGLRSGAEDGR
jgi:hypothetical protein